MMALPGGTHSETTACKDLPESTLAAMHHLLDRHFEGVTREQFEADLAEKNHVILVHRGSRLVGFSTLHISSLDFEGEILNLVYSGDTIMAPEAWGSTLLARTWIRTVRDLTRPLQGTRTFWLLLTSGFRTYRFLSVFWSEFHPHHACPAPPFHHRLAQHCALQRFGQRYDPKAGVVRFAHPQRLRAGLDTIPAGRMKDSHIACFARLNPRFNLGDELVCLTELSPENLTPAGRRMVDTDAS